MKLSIMKLLNRPVLISDIRRECWWDGLDLETQTTDKASKVDSRFEINGEKLVSLDMYRVYLRIETQNIETTWSSVSRKQHFKDVSPVSMVQRSIRNVQR